MNSPKVFLRAAYAARTRRAEQQRVNDTLSAMQYGLLLRPKTDPIDEEVVHDVNGMQVAHTSIQGYRINMEDKHVIGETDIDGHSVIAIFDGHAGDGAAKRVSKHVLECIQMEPDWAEYKKSVSLNSKSGKLRTTDAMIDTLCRVLIGAFKSLDTMLADAGVISGCTAVVALVTPTNVLCASVGDSRCVICQTNGACVALSKDHKPENPMERRRIELAGGFVADNRVNGELAMSRALGDFQYKQRGSYHIDDFNASPKCCVFEKPT
jgi:serine/threonine protein phosphatase PrpC